MKKSPKKLSLTRETLRGLQTHRLAEILGGLAAPVVPQIPHSVTLREDCCVP
jgi:hypothetical protein